MSFLAGKSELSLQTVAEEAVMTTTAAATTTTTTVVVIMPPKNPLIALYVARKDIGPQNAPVELAKVSRKELALCAEAPDIR